MRDGEGRKLSDDDAAKVKAAQVKPREESLKKVSVDPTPGPKPPGEAPMNPGPGATR